MPPELQRRLEQLPREHEGVGVVLDVVEALAVGRHGDAEQVAVAGRGLGLVRIEPLGTELLAGDGIKASVSRKGNRWDNACSETLLGLAEGRRAARRAI